RENVFDRVRELDSEFSRLETSLVSLDWTKELLRELIERRLNDRLIAKYALDGSCWKAFFQGEPEESQKRVFSYCQFRPRDVLLYTSTALSLAQSHQRAQIFPEDLDEAQRSFSENRLKELADEYADNYPRLSIVLTRFYGLGTSVASKTSLRSYSLIRKYRTHVRLGSTTLPRQIDSFSCYTT